ncbi:MAG: nucleotidyltransferase domain-containing protein [Bacteroidota bacterium]
MIQEIYKQIVHTLEAELKRFYGNRLVSVCLYGSVARGTMNNTSDLDLLVVARDLPRGRVKRIDEFRTVERALERILGRARKNEVYCELSPVIKTPEEVNRGSLLFLDMLEDGKILYDRGGFLNRFFEKFRRRLQRLGAKRIWRGETWYWMLKEHYKPGEVFEI